MDVKWCNMDDDGQMEREEQRRDAVVIGEKAINRGGECGSQPELCQPVQRAQRLKNICDIPLLLNCMFQGMLLDIVILQRALMGLQWYQAHPSERDTAAMLLLLGLLKVRCLSVPERAVPC